jgi:hypothetical protein
MDVLEAAIWHVEEVYRLTDDVGIPTMEGLWFSRDEIRCSRASPTRIRRHGNAREVDTTAYEEIYRTAFDR